MSSIEITSGSDATVQFAFKDIAGAAIAISNPAIIGSQNSLSGLCTATLVDGPGGLASVFIEGSDPITTGSYWLRLQVTLSDGNTLASEKVLINVR